MYMYDCKGKQKRKSLFDEMAIPFPNIFSHKDTGHFSQSPQVKSMFVLNQDYVHTSSFNNLNSFLLWTCPGHYFNIIFMARSYS